MVPTTVPTSVPTNVPVTSFPTYVGETINPTSAPTTQPTAFYGLALKSQFYKDYEDYSEYLYSNSFTKIFYTNFFYKGRIFTGTCNEWNYYKENEIKVPSADMYFSSLKVAYGYSDIESSTPAVTKEVTCADTSSIADILDALIFNKALITYCGGEVWKVSTCERFGAVLCVNCTGGCNSCPGTTFITNPCNQKCISNMAAYAIMDVDIGYKELFPKILESTVTAIYSKNATVMLNVTKPGSAFCRLYDAHDSIPDSVENFRRKTMNPLTLNEGLNYLFIPNMSPSTLYYLYCLTEDLGGNAMGMDDLLNTKLTLETSCCRYLSFEKFTPGINQWIDESSQIPPEYSFKLSGKPDGRTVIKLSAMTCDPAYTLKYPDFSPYQFIFDENSLVLEGSFRINAEEQGCFLIKVDTDRRLSHTVYDYDIRTLNVKPVTAPPDPAHLQSAVYASDGLSVSITFSKRIDMDKMMLGLLFPCLSLFYISSVNYSHFDNLDCFWTSDATSIVLRGSVINMVNVYDSISLKSEKSTVCASTKPDLCVTANFTSIDVPVVIEPPLNAPVPNVVLIGPLKVGFCDVVSIDPSQSTGSLSRPWKSLLMTVDSESTDMFGDLVNLTLIENHLLWHPIKSTNDIVEIPRSYFPAGIYTFSLVLENHYGIKSSASLSVETIGEYFVPLLSIMGPQVEPFLFLIDRYQIHFCTHNIFSRSFELLDGKI